MPFFQSFNISNKGSSWIEKNQDHSKLLFGVQQWSYYKDLIIESGIKDSISSSIFVF